jgi:hypothetical protein
MGETSEGEGKSKGDGASMTAVHYMHVRKQSNETHQSFFKGGREIRVIEG